MTEDPEISEPRAPSTEGRRVSLTVVLSCGLAVSALATYSVMTADVEIGGGLRRALPVLQVALWLSVVVQAMAIVAVWRRRVAVLPLRVVFYASALALGAFHVFLQPFWKFYLDLTTVLFFGAVAILALLGPRLARIVPRRLLSGLDILAFNVCIILVGGELALRTWHAIRPTPLLAPTDSSTLARLDRYRQTPGSVYLGHPVNSKGYYDDEFRAKQGDERRVVCVGDSFNVGVVPHAMHYTTICEQLSSRKTIVENVGIGGIGPSEYLLLLERDILPTKPDAVLVSLFVGNDIAEAGKGRVGHRGLRSVFDRGNLRLYLLPRRLVRLARERQVRDGSIGGVQGASNAQRIEGRESLVAAFPWLEDPSKEVATFSEANYLDETTRRALTVRPSERESYARLEQDLREMRDLCGETPLYVILQAAEWQVDDELWQRITEHAGADAQLDRDAPQRLCAAILDELQIPWLDVLPALRAVPPLSDGKRHVFHLRDTHYNARGNRVVGAALAEFLSAR